jgi:hypothetical protein
VLHEREDDGAPLLFGPFEERLERGNGRLDVDPRV